MLKTHFGERTQIFFFTSLYHLCNSGIICLHFMIYCTSFDISRNHCLIAPRIDNRENKAAFFFLLSLYRSYVVFFFSSFGSLENSSPGLPLCDTAEPQTFILSVRNQAIFRW